MTNCEMLTSLWEKDMEQRAKRGDVKAMEALRRYRVQQQQLLLMM